MAKKYKDEHKIVDEVIQKIGKKIILGSPLAAGKANHIVNAFYQRALADKSIDLTICTALTLEKPRGKSDLEKRFLNPFADRVFGDYPDLDYEQDRMKGALPDNIEVIEFYFPPGKYVGNDSIQQNYVSSNYTHVTRDMLDRKINVVAQLVAKKEIDGQNYFSLSCNPDVTIDIIDQLKATNATFTTIAQVNQNLPFMYGDAMVEEGLYDFVLDEPEKYFKVFGPPKMSVSEADFMIGLYCSTLVKDDGELQIGIGSLGDSTVYNLLLRHNQNAEYQALLSDLKIKEKFGEVINKLGDTSPFEKGLFGASEMLVDGFMHLYNAGIVKKKAYDHVGLQKLINRDLIKETFSDDILEVLLENKVIHGQISKKDFDFLQYWGIFKEDLSYSDKTIQTGEGMTIKPHIREPESLEALKKHCLGNSLKNGQIMQGGFFLGPQRFYKWLKELPNEEKKLINMKSVLKINQLYGHEALDRLHRKNARFINSCMMQTLSGAAVSDGLENGQVISGVGGQYNFVAMAQELPDGNSILNLRSTRNSKGKFHSNIVPFYGHITIPRHLRDVVVTEYGIAYIRGCTDQEIIKKILNITDSRFQNELMIWAKKVGKLEKHYQIPSAFSNNYPASYLEVVKKYKSKGFYKTFPFGTDLTDDEIVIGKALKSLKNDLSSKPNLLKTLFKGLFLKPKGDEKRLLERMGLLNTQNIKEWVYQKLLLSKLNS
ncbi:MAG: acetyl-CoA hydrolase/transferase C-terminal domain-containing protein [Saprospiraceae bacterium]|jgi:acyl-CoA hydrolase|nr:acetyl-CoA hydrolase/transferase C-terminal domain-containing protein [Saprospiraceae bacterium]